MNLDFLTPLSMVYVRVSMILQYLYYEALARREAKSIQRLYYKGQAWGAWCVFTGKFKLTPASLGSQLDFINKMVFCIIFNEIVQAITAVLKIIMGG